EVGGRSHPSTATASPSSIAVAAPSAEPPSGPLSPSDLIGRWQLDVDGFLVGSQWALDLRADGV
ncbi:MAG: hypothetical protein SGJ09_03260, partial [Phycisphaerae bacterium]|nr:hypothetical protein [Phycisphaerae bacterium]